MRLLGISGLAGSGKDTFASFFQPFNAANVALADPLKRIARDVYDFSDQQLWGPSEERNKPDPRYPRRHTWHPINEVEGFVCACCGQKRRISESHEGSSPCYLTPRYALQLLGTDWGRQCYPNTWVDKCIRMASTLLYGKPTRMHYVYALNYDGPREAYMGTTYPLYSAQEGAYDFQDRSEAGRIKLVTVSDVRFQNEIDAIQKAGGKVVRVKRPGAGLGGAAGQHPSEAEQLSIPDSAFDFVVENGGTLEELEALAIKIGRGMIG